ncbi:hypothetical protein B0H94_101260 [Salsuginibacillus halophilus]|uniref:Uncharacterized protein n=1 Tax=Salsuginibacillus halophilus TaxID=517424 RepID=A0A2P8HYP8_9BACI|nr:hypothetical protein [Salsuginibacillus halophilus]PSL51346.1 hypothetical protein B0H94_101260 [Salsuginibacillus halophilus]
MKQAALWRKLRWSFGVIGGLWMLLVIFTDGAVEVTGLFAFIISGFLFSLGLELLFLPSEDRGFAYVSLFGGFLALFFAVHRVFGIMTW